MLTLVTGNPGAGKTLHTLELVEKQRLEAVTEKREDGSPRYPNGRAVYQSGISKLKLPWLTLEDPRKWFECPEGSMIVIDEAWRPFPMRKAGEAVPRYIEEFAVHRHRGFDIYLTTQHRHQIDTFVRKMVGRHIHLERKHGAESATIWQWEKETDTNSTKQKDSALKMVWAHPKHIYDWYESAEVHTVKKDFPWRRFWWLWPLAATVLFLIGYAVFRVRHIAELGKKPADAPSVAGVSAPGAPVAPMGIARGEIWRPGQGKAREWFIPGSAPRYDASYRVSTVPVVAGCLELDEGIHVRKCVCTAQGGSVLPVTTMQCLELVKSGVFDPSQRYDDAKQTNIAFLNSHQNQSGPPDFAPQSVATSPPGVDAGTGGESAAHGQPTYLGAVPASTMSAQSKSPSYP